MNFFEKFPFACSSGLLSSIGFEDIKPILVVVFAFGVDTGLKYVHQRINNKKDKS